MTRAWRAWMLAAAGWWLGPVASMAGEKAVRIEVANCAAAASVSAPVSVEVALPQAHRTAARGRLRLVEEPAGPGQAPPVLAQYDPQAGRLWWLMPPGKQARRTFRLTASSSPDAAGLTATYDADRHRVHLREGKRPILTYNHGTTEVPKGIAAKYARGDYIHPLHGPDGQVLTDDYPRDHPHHRGINWSWATVLWKGEERDMFGVGVRPKGCWARPAGKPSVRGGPVAACIEAACLWKWDDREPIAREEVSIRAFRQADRGRFVDVEVRLTALVEGLQFCGRRKAGYSGFNLRMAPAKGQKILFHTDPAASRPRCCWADYSADFAGSQGRVGVAVLQHAANPRYPHEWRQYARLNFYQPIFPGPKPIPMPKGRPIVLKHRLWIHPGGADAGKLRAAWSAYNDPPKAAAGKS